MLAAHALAFGCAPITPVQGRSSYQKVDQRIYSGIFHDQFRVVGIGHFDNRKSSAPQTLSKYRTAGYIFFHNQKDRCFRIHDDRRRSAKRSKHELTRGVPYLLLAVLQFAKWIPFDETQFNIR